MTKQTIIVGLHAVSSLLQRQPERILRLCVMSERHDIKMETLLKAAKTLGLAIEHTSKQTLDKLTQEANHQGILAYCQPMPAYQEKSLPMLLGDLSVPPLVLVLDNVQDPHNLGACFRTAEAAGVHAIIAPKDKSASITPVVSKVACGAAEIVPFVQVTNLVRTLEALKELRIWVYGAAGEASQSLYQTDLTGAAALVLGAEGSGLRRLTREHCDALVHIPMQGSVSSLNVSVATGVMLFEVVRQRGNISNAI